MADEIVGQLFWRSLPPPLHRGLDDERISRRQVCRPHARNRWLAHLSAAQSASSPDSGDIGESGQFCGDGPETPRCRTSTDKLTTYSKWSFAPGGCSVRQ